MWCFVAAVAFHCYYSVALLSLLLISMCLDVSMRGREEGGGKGSYTASS
jgi:hypothetical protein